MTKKQSSFAFLGSRTSVIHKKLFNVQCWYAQNACEIFQITAYSIEDAKQKAREIAWHKGYLNAQNDCDFVI